MDDVRLLQQPRKKFCVENITEIKFAKMSYDLYFALQ